MGNTISFAIKVFHLWKDGTDAKTEITGFPRPIYLGGLNDKRQPFFPSPFPLNPKMEIRGCLNVGVLIVVVFPASALSK